MISTTKKTTADKKIVDPLASVKQLAKASDPDPRHAAQVTKLALALFDKLKGLHCLEARDRFLLGVTAMLHDIGWARAAGGGHHKHSRDMIMEAELPGLTEAERTLCALTARYHTKAEPDASRHKRFGKLSKKERAIVSWLAAILRVADGLDCTHSGRVRIRGCDLNKKSLTISLIAAGGCAGEISGAEKKSRFLGRMADRNVIFGV